jgi:DNA-binding LytR/AlgR family response regulator
MLSSSYFAVPHNSYIINLNYVKKFKRDEISLAEPFSDVSISIASRKQVEFKRQFLDFIGEDYSNEYDNN